MQEHNFQTYFCKKPVQCSYIKSRDKAWKIVQELQAKDILYGIDTETAPYDQYRSWPKAGLKPQMSRIRLIQIYDPNENLSYVFDLDFIQDNSIFINFLETKRLLAHNAIFEYKFFRMMGVKKMDIGCTRLLYKLISHAVYADDSGLSASLENICDKILGEPILKKMQISDWGSTELTFEQIEYAALDPVACYMIGKRLSPGLIKLGLEKSYNLVKRVQYPIGEMQLNGIYLDKKSYIEVIHSWRDELFEAKKVLRELLNSTDITDKVIRNWLDENLDEETHYIWPRTEPTKAYPDGQLSVSAHAFTEFSYLPIVQPLANFKMLDKLSSTYGDSLLNNISPVTGKLHADYNICGARTGRLSSSYPNLQQFPGKKHLRAHFKPIRPGWKYIGADFSQIEVRVIAELSGDKALKAIYRDGLDVYSATAAKLTNKPVESIGKKSRERKMAKALVLGLLFGLGASKFAHYAKKGYGIDVTPQESLENIKAFRKLFPGLREWQLNQANTCSSSLSAITVGGKKRALAADNYYGACLNHPVQGTAAEIIEESLIGIHEFLIESEMTDTIKFVNCVHDDITMEAPDYLAEDTEQMMHHCMTQAYLKSFPNGITNKLVDSYIDDSWAGSKDD